MSTPRPPRKSLRNSSKRTRTSSSCSCRVLDMALVNHPTGDDEGYNTSVIICTLERGRSLIISSRRKDDSQHPWRCSFSTTAVKIAFVTWVVLSVGHLSGQEAFDVAIRQIVVQANQGAGTWQIATNVSPQERRQLPVGVFDSGIGGLTVLEAILGLDAFNNETLQPGADGRLDFEGERFVYFGDQANMPYGNYASAGKQDFLRELILRDAVFLLGRRYWRSSLAPEPSMDKLPVKAIAAIRRQLMDSKTFAKPLLIGNYPFPLSESSKRERADSWS
jgi:hypothetical protein